MASIAPSMLGLFSSGSSFAKAVPAIVTGLGTATSAISQIAGGNAADAAAKQNAANAVESAQDQEEQQRMADRRTLATARATIGASGVQLTGSPLDVMAESARQAEMNALIIRRGGQLEANADLVAGENAQRAGLIKAGTTVLTGGYNIGKQVAAVAAPKVGLGGPVYFPSEPDTED